MSNNGLNLDHQYRSMHLSIPTKYRKGSAITFFQGTRSFDMRDRSRQPVKHLEIQPMDSVSQYGYVDLLHCNNR